MSAGAVLGNAVDGGRVGEGDVAGARGATLQVL